NLAATLSWWTTIVSTRTCPGSSRLSTKSFMCLVAAAVYSACHSPDHSELSLGDTCARTSEARVPDMTATAARTSNSSSGAKSTPTTARSGSVTCQSCGTDSTACHAPGTRRLAAL